MYERAQEIADAKWMPMAEYRQSAFVKSRPAILELVRCMEGFVQGAYSGFSTTSLAAGDKRPPQLCAHGLDENTSAD